MDNTATAYHTTDKTDFGPGPWQDEPDKVQWVDPSTGLDCLIVRNPGGALCGYVGVPPDHRWHGVDYSDCTRPIACDETWCGHGPDNYMRVHGGLTYADRCQESEDPSRGICHVPAEGRPDNVWWFGFDCAHAGDLCPWWEQRGVGLGGVYRDLSYVESEVASLASQLAEVSA